MSCGGFQGLGSLGAGDTGFQHDEGDGDVVAGGFQGIVSLLAIDIGGVLEDGDSALGKLAVLQTQIDHEVAIDVAETGHGTSGNHVQNHLLGGAGFHAARACQDFGADVGDDAKWAARSSWELGLQVRAMVSAPRLRAYSTAAIVKGVRPLAAMPITTSFFVGLRLTISARPSSRESSLASASAPRALGPPAMMYCTRLGGVAKVGGISEASRAPMRPLVPVPT